ncbi:MAG TPA: ParB/RepB/Spo0J family partition protein [Candidatus Wunengus sp. YC63]|uniref:ParB/RepB/Spo0J family partition protein n=1 Tax=Candidatus Wunengus sp. YC63 TaxID=3367699 RepID=UPI0027136DF0|nr:ParB/RepB/Spo0J family partition protein [Candidatus Brocadiales bacterium]
MAEESIYDIPISQIKVADTNVRHTERDKELDELMASIKKHGLLQPVVLEGKYGNPPYELIVGQRRFLAHQKLGKQTIRARFAGQLSDVQATIRSLVENMLRVDLNHADTAQAITNLYREFGKDEDKVHVETGLSIRRVRQYIDVGERTTPKMKQKLQDKKATLIDIQRVLKASAGDSSKAERLLEKIEKLTKYEKDNLVEYGESHPRADAEKIIQEAQKPRIERTIMVKLSERARQGLKKASDELAMSPDEVAAHALEDWLSKQGFISE